MKKNPFHFEIKDLLIQFVAAFDDVVIGRYNRARELQDQLAVKYVYAPKQRVLHDLVNKPQHITVPAIAVSVDIGINMSVITKYQTDMDQILTNFIPYTDPYIIISWQNPDVNLSIPQEIRSPVEWSGSISMAYPTELAGNQPYRVTADTTFIIKGWMFKAEQRQIPNILTVSVNAEHVLHNQQITNKGVIYEIDNEVLTPPKFTIDEDYDG